MKHTVTTKIMLNHRYRRLSGEYAIAIRVTYLREAIHFTLSDFYLTKEDFEKVQSGKCRGSLKEIQIALQAIEARAKEIIQTITPFSFDAFKKKFEGKEEFQKQVLNNNVFEHFGQAIQSLKAENRLGTASSYQCSLNSLKAYHGKGKLTFHDINPDFLQAYERWMLDAGNSPTSIGIYLRNLRTLYNKAVNEGIVPNDKKPFGRGRYTIPTGKNTKKALTKEDVVRITNYPVKEGTSEHFARDMWYFSYLGNGMNIKDIALLKYKNLIGGKICFQRAKTAKTTKANPKLITVMLQPAQTDIINRWGNADKSPDNYLFPILTQGLDAEKERKTIMQQTKTINKYMKRIGKVLNLGLTLTTYVARHSFATVLKRSGAPIEAISEMLGHSDLKTTENYLDSFTDETLMQYAKLLT